MILFNTIDRPEDRPNTLLWCSLGNTLSGTIINKAFQWIFAVTKQADMTLVTLLILGFGDGLAEPIGIYFGRHIYWVNAWCTVEKRRYQRSLEGSSCVWITSIVSISIFFYFFQNQIQFWTAIIILPPLMTFAEALSPHTLDNCILLVVGNVALLLIGHLQLAWK
ncbi:unnamed protein product [Rotaria sp. Silwood2]|nr:unnamed protein product [Rotaria sp. Silwood2]CAF3019768.1 unnamed protein product [Rotaria sp. Silwood2]CAF3070476.1 unnamed protein product [Rotaria sp. Silwood2]CAF3378948.1 unnamed protein product [Rotaria sp. Silwood2]CAF4067857.1 unnamed protein product [Rotaria sp. Silwood2]